MRFDPKNTLILVALEAELPNEMIPSWNVAYTGVGKVNAALKGSEYVARYKPMNLINFGTAGALNPELSGLLEVTQFFQRDMDARDMGFALGQTPFEEAPAQKCKALLRKGSLNDDAYFFYKLFFLKNNQVKSQYNLL